LWRVSWLARAPRGQEIVQLPDIFARVQPKEGIWHPIAETLLVGSD